MDRGTYLSVMQKAARAGAAMTPEERYRNIRELSDVFRNRGMLKNLLIRHIEEAEAAATEEAAKSAETLCWKETGDECVKIAYVIRARLKANKPKGEPNANTQPE